MHLPCPHRGERTRRPSGPCPKAAGRAANLAAWHPASAQPAPQPGPQLSADIEPHAKVLVLGTGEFMHWPFYWANA